MKTLTSILILISLWVCPIVSVHKERNLLHNQFKDKTKSLDHLNEWRIKLKDEFKTTLKNLPDDVKKAIISDADNVLKTPWEPLLAMTFLEFKINGNRNHFEGQNFNRRKRLEALVLAELLTEKEQYLNEIANGIWLIMEESTWTWPAHIGVQKAGTGLPDPNQWIIDLGAGESSAQVAWVKFLVGKFIYQIMRSF